jgi:hypothetical protein
MLPALVIAVMLPVPIVKPIQKIPGPTDRIHFQILLNILCTIYPSIYVERNTRDEAIVF